MGLFLLILFIAVAAAGLLGWGTDSRQYANWPPNSDMPSVPPRT